jgi:hypothetical protein
VTRQSGRFVGRSTAHRCARPPGYTSSTEELSTGAQLGRQRHCRVVSALQHSGAMKYIDNSALAHVTGGMSTEGFPISTNVEDRRGMSVKERMRVKSPAVAPLPPLVRAPGDLSSQAGLDNIIVRRRR